MTYTAAFEVPGMTTEEYDTIHADALPDGLTDGQLLHVATDMGDRVQVFEVWESEDAFAEFITGHFSEVAEKHGLPQADPAFEGSAHNVVLE